MATVVGGWIIAADPAEATTVHAHQWVVLCGADQCGRVDGNRLATQQVVLIGHLQHELEHLFMDSEGQSIPDTREAGMIGRTLGCCQAEKTSQG